jgi:hypothetical protein
MVSVIVGNLGFSANDFPLLIHWSLGGQVELNGQLVTVPA